MNQFEMIRNAADTLHDVARLTPIIPFDSRTPNLFIKAENLQKTGSFKIRGAFNKLSSLTVEEASKGVIACSAGNHAQGVAYSAMRLGMRAVICMPDYAPVMKVEGTRAFGAEVVLVPGNYDDSAKEAKRLADENGYTFAHPFNDPYVIAGQGTIGLEILSQMPDVEQVVVPIGGGGLISGVAIAIKSLKPSVKVIGVQTINVPSMYASFSFDEVETLKDKATIADGIHVLTPGNLTFEIVEKYVDDIVTVRESEIEAAMVALMERSKLVAEGAGATSVAAFMYDRINTDLRTVAVVSGGNVDISTLGSIIERELKRREA
ncbi:MAG: threonine ammonia-lyase [Clostridia bacterium]|nr:threonine ammonia-lyase [Clostridia bacterium]